MGSFRRKCWINNRKTTCSESDSTLLSPSRWLVTPGFMTDPISQSNLKQPWEQSNYAPLSPGCRDEGLTHLDCLKGSIAVQAGDAFSPIVTFPPVSLNLVQSPTTCCRSLFFAGTPRKVPMVGKGQQPVYLKWVGTGTKMHNKDIYNMNIIYRYKQIICSGQNPVLCSYVLPFMFIFFLSTSWQSCHSRHTLSSQSHTSVKWKHTRHHSQIAKISSGGTIVDIHLRWRSIN